MLLSNGSAAALFVCKSAGARPMACGLSVRIGHEQTLTRRLHEPPLGVPSAGNGKWSGLSWDALPDVHVTTTNLIRDRTFL